MFIVATFLHSAIYLRSEHFLIRPHALHFCVFLFTVNLSTANGDFTVQG